MYKSAAAALSRAAGAVTCLQLTLMRACCFTIYIPAREATKMVLPAQAHSGHRRLAGLHFLRALLGLLRLDAHGAAEVGEAGQELGFCIHR